MTEKRFTYEYDEYNGNLFDNKMNTFYHIEDSDENIEVLCDRLNWLVEENEQLKNHIQELQNHLKRLENENIQTYTLIKEAYNNERTQLGQSVLKQLMETIQ